MYVFPAGAQKSNLQEWRSAAKEKPGISRYFLKRKKTDNFNLRRTLSGLFFVIPECLASISAVVLAFTANKQANTLNDIYIYII